MLRGATNSSVVVVAQVLQASVRNHLRALSENGMLRTAHTGYAYQSRRWLERTGRACDTVLGTKLTARLSIRPEIQGVPDTCLNNPWLPEAVQFVLMRFLRTPHYEPALDWRQSRLSALAARSLRPSDRLVLAPEDEALEAFQAAAKLGLSRLYQLPIAHYATVDRILRSELELYPDEQLLALRESSMAPHRIARKDAELSLASQVLVPSLFVKQSLLDVGVDEARIHLLPFGAEPEWILDEQPQKNLNLFLHVGHLSIRKGTHRLLRAWKRLGAYRTCELRLIGSMQLPQRFLSDFQGVCNYIGKVPRQSLRQHYSAASCFVLPSLAEGFAMVILESLSCGTPIVASRNSGAPGFIEEGEEGLLHDAQNDDQLCEALDWMLANPQNRIEMGHRCLNKARTWTWQHYRFEFSKFIAGLLKCENINVRSEANEHVAS